MTLGELVRSFRLKHGYSMDDFARAAGMSKAYVSILERNYNPSSGKPVVPSIQTMQAIADVMGMTVDEVLHLLEPNQPVELVESPPPVVKQVPSVFAARMRALREEKGYTTEYVGRQLGLRSQHISNYELDKRRPDYNLLGKFADLYGVSVDYLLGKTDIRSPAFQERPSGQLVEEDQPEIYLHLLQGAKDLDLDKHDIEILLSVARTLKEQAKEREAEEK